MRFVHPALQNLVMVFQYSGTLDRKVLVELVLGYNKESGRWGEIKLVTAWLHPSFLVHYERILLEQNLHQWRYHRPTEYSLDRGGFG